MKPARLWVLGVVLVVASGAGAQEDAVPPSVAAEDPAARALAVYEQGKQLYDAQDYAGALARFDEAAAIEPSKARWQYNRGLALRKLGRSEEAREALLQSRALEPEYKRAEIDDKLGELNEPTRETRSAPSSNLGDFGKILCVLGGFGGFGLFFWGLWRWLGAPDKPSSGRYTPNFSTPEQRAQQRARLTPAGEQLIQVEHALRLREDADLRAQLNQATQAEQRARQALVSAEKGIATPEFLKNRVDEVEQQAAQALASARELFGEQGLEPGGERVGCYFCARPLANPDFRKRVPLKRGPQVTEVLSCPPCANMAAAGQPLPVKVRPLHGGKLQHWSEMLGYDPYIHRHQPFPNTTTVPAWEYTPSRPLGEVAAIAAGGALATGLAAYGVSQLLDLDSASEAASVRAATEAAAKKASERREERDWKDHS